MAFTLPLTAKDDVQAGINIARQLSKAFAYAASKATPATVFIVCEGEALQPQSMFGAVDPFGLFGDDFFNKHFGFSPRNQQQQQPRKQRAQGSGFIVSKDGYIMTNYHVVQNAVKITVALNGMKGKEFEASFIGGDPQTDTALLKLENPPLDLPMLEFTDSDDIEVGEWVIAVGSPFELEASVTAGIVSAKGRKNLQLSELENFIQTDAAINPGNSGGPLLTLEGLVVGINTAIVGASGGNLGIGFAVPSNIARNVMEQIIKTGSVTRGYIGATLQPVDKGLAESFGLDKAEGALVVDVMEGSPGDEAGLQQGDVILEIDNTPIRDHDSLRNEVMLNPPGTTVKLKVKRGDKVFIVPVKLGSHTSDSVVIAGSTEKLGITVEDINQDNIRKFRINPAEEGVVIVEVKAGSIGAREGLKPGFIIQGIDHQRVSSTEEFDTILRNSKGKNRVLMLIKIGNVKKYVSVRLK